MSKEWRPSASGQIFTGSPEWHLRLDGHVIELTVNGQIHRATIDRESTLRVHQGLIWTDLTLCLGSIEKKVDGLPNDRAKPLKAALAEVLAERKLKNDLEYFTNDYSAIRGWLGQVQATIQQAKAERRWITHELQLILHRSRPNLDSHALWSRFRNPSIQQQLPDAPKQVENILKLWESDWPTSWGHLNEAEQQCPACKRGVIITRNGRYGEFQSCSNFPRCEHKPKSFSPRKRAGPTNRPP